MSEIDQPLGFEARVDLAREIFVGEQVNVTNSGCGALERTNHSNRCTEIVITNPELEQVDFVFGTRRDGVILGDIDADKRSCTGDLYLTAGTRTFTVKQS